MNSIVYLLIREVIFSVMDFIFWVTIEIGKDFLLKKPDKPLELKEDHNQIT